TGSGDAVVARVRSVLGLWLKVIGIVSVSLCAPPLPVFPKSFAAIVRLAAPVNPNGGRKFRKSRRELMVAIVPVKVMAEVLLAPLTKVRPAVLVRVIVPLVALSVTWTGLVPASTSVTAIP